MDRSSDPRRLGAARPSDGRRVVALYGRDLLDPPSDLDAGELAGEGFELLALDRSAVGGLLELGLPFSTVEDWLDAAGLPTHDVYDVAAATAPMWAATRPEGLTTDGVLWPELDYWQVPDVWATMIVTARLCRALAASEVIEFRFGVGHRAAPSEAYKAPLPAVAEAFSELLPGVARPIAHQDPDLRHRVRDAISRTPIGGPLRALRGAIGTLRFLREARRTLREAADSRRILVMLPRRELDRSRAIVRTIAEHFGGGVVALPWTSSAEEAHIAAGLTDSLPTVLLPRMERGFRRDERRLRRGVAEDLRHHDLGELEQVRGPMLHALQYLAEGWAAHARRLRWAVRVLGRLAPDVVVTAREPLAYQVPREAARLLGSTVLTLPHGVVEWCPQQLLQPDVRTIHVAGIHNPTAPQDSMVACHDALVRYEYPQRVRAFEPSGRSGVLRLAALTDGFGEMDRPTLNVRLHQALLVDLVNAAERCGPDVEILIKPHPGGPDDERLLLVQAAQDASAAVQVLPRDTDVIALMASCDLVIGLNSVTSALVHAAEMGRPIVRWTTNPVFYTADDSRDLPAWNRFFAELLASVGSADELVAFIGRFRTEPGFVTGLEERSRNMTSRLRLDAPSISVVEAVERLLSVGREVSRP